MSETLKSPELFDLGPLPDSYGFWVHLKELKYDNHYQLFDRDFTGVAKFA
jgi:hypothetical protein